VTPPLCPPGYRLHADLFGDFDGASPWAFLIWGNLLALLPLGVLALLLWLPYQLYAALGTPLALFPDPGWSGVIPWLAGGVIVLASMLLHEGLHALALRLLGFHPRLAYESGFLFAAVRPGEYLTRRAYTIMVLTPLLSMTVGGGALLLWLPASVGQLVLVALLLNGAASIGDLMVALRVRQQPHDALFASDAGGIRVYVRESR
jgi:hypothetical protein